MIVTKPFFLKGAVVNGWLASFRVALARQVIFKFVFYGVSQQYSPDPKVVSLMIAGREKREGNSPWKCPRLGERK